jgi:hypothetical protein
VQASPRPLPVVLAIQETQSAKLGLRDAWNNIERGQYTWLLLLVTNSLILHRSPQQLGTTAEHVPHGFTSHIMTVKLAAVLGPPEHRRIYLVQILLAP